MHETTVHGLICLACGSPLAECLARAGSPRCHDCRELDSPVRADLFGRQRTLLAQREQHAEAA